MPPADAAALRRHNGDRRADQRDPEIARSIAEAIRPVLERLAQEMSLCLRYYSVTFRGQPLAQVVLGGGEASPSLVEWFAARIDLPCELGNPLRTLREGPGGRPGRPMGRGRRLGPAGGELDMAVHARHRLPAHRIPPAPRPRRSSRGGSSSLWPSACCWRRRPSPSTASGGRPKAELLAVDPTTTPARGLKTSGRAPGTLRSGRERRRAVHLPASSVARTQLLAAVVHRCPRKSRSARSRSARKRRPTAPPSRGAEHHRAIRAAEDGEANKTPPAARLKRLRADWDKTPSCRADRRRRRPTQPPSTLSRRPEQAPPVRQGRVRSIESLETPQGTTLRFRAVLPVRPGYGQPGGPERKSEPGPRKAERRVRIPRPVARRPATEGSRHDHSRSPRKLDHHFPPGGRRRRIRRLFLLRAAAVAELRQQIRTKQEFVAGAGRCQGP